MLNQDEMDMYEFLKKACEKAEYLANWDKSPQQEWYYAAKRSLKIMEDAHNKH